MPALREIYSKLEKLEKGGGSTETKPEDVDEAFSEYAETDEDELEDLNW